MMRLLAQPVLLLSLVAAPDVFWCGADTDPKPAPKTTRGKFPIGKDTTYVTGPVDKDGYIDYAAALNEWLGKGVTPETNANVFLWKALGPHPEGATMPAEFFQWMGVAQPPERGDYFIPLSRYIKETLRLEPGPATQEVNDQLQRATQRPWTAKESPALAGWLKANEKPLAVAIEATKRTHYFSPLTPPKGGLIGALLPAVQKCRELASALSARAMLRTGGKATDAAWQDLLACHRLGRLVGRGGTFIEGLVGLAIDRIAFNADLAFLDRTKPNAKQIDKYLSDLRSLPPLFAMAEKVDLGERFLFLDTVVMVDRYGINYLEALAGGEPKAPNPLGKIVMDGIDWELGLKNANQWYDRIVAAMRQTDRAARVKALDEIEADLKASKKRLTDSGELNKKLLGEPKERGKALGDVLIGLLLPAGTKMQSSSDRAHQVQDNVLVAFSLAGYHRDHGRYPDQLEALAPKYLAKVPGDRFSGKSLVYRPEQKGYLLYSVGPNGTDDDGRGPDDTPPGDDLSVRVPLPELKRK